MKIRILSIFFLLIVVASTTLVASEEPVRLDLNAEDISEVRFTDKRDIHLELSESASLKLKNLTGDNLGKKLSVTYLNHIVITATIQTMISSGRITISNPSDATWEKMKKLQKNY